MSEYPEAAQHAPCACIAPAGEAPPALDEPRPELHVGALVRLVRHVRSSGFKLALIVGTASADHDPRWRVRLWRANSGRWTTPTLVYARELRELADSETTGPRRAVIRRAIEAAKEAGLLRPVPGAPPRPTVSLAALRASSALVGGTS